MRRRLHYFLLIALMIVSVCFAETVSVSAAKKISATIFATSVKVGKTVQITTKLKNVTFTSSDEKIACVDADGTVSGKKPGTVTISMKKKGYQTKKFKITVKKVKISAGAGFIVVLTGDIMTMPGLPKIPAAEKIDVTDDGKIIGLF